MIIGPTFFSSPSGDHPAGDGLTRLQTAFAGASSADISSYAIGSGTISGPAVVSEGKLTCTIVGTTLARLAWTNAGLHRIASTALTVEYFVRLIEVTVNPVPSAQSIASIDNVDGLEDTGGDSGAHLLGYNGYSGGINLPAMTMETQYNVSPSPTYDIFAAGMLHVAYVWDDSASGSLSVYLNGTRLYYKASSVGHWLSGNSLVILGGVAPGHSVTAEFTGVRVRRAEMYTGASFTPPANPAAWGPP